MRDYLNLPDREHIPEVCLAEFDAHARAAAALKEAVEAHDRATLELDNHQKSNDQKRLLAAKAGEDPGALKLPTKAELEEAKDEARSMRAARLVAARTTWQRLMRALRANRDAVLKTADKPLEALDTKLTDSLNTYIEAREETLAKLKDRAWLSLVLTPDQHGTYREFEAGPMPQHDPADFRTALATVTRSPTPLTIIRTSEARQLERTAKEAETRRKRAAASTGTSTLSRGVTYTKRAA